MSALVSYAPLQRRMISRRRGMGSITWGNRQLGLITRDGIVTDFNNVSVSPMIDGSDAPFVPLPFPGNPDTRPGAWPGLVPQNTGGTVTANTLPAQVPVVVTPTSGPIPAPGTVAAGTAAPASWLEQSLIGGIANKWLLVGGIGAFLFFGGKKK